MANKERSQDFRLRTEISQISAGLIVLFLGIVALTGVSWGTDIWFQIAFPIVGILCLLAASSILMESWNRLRH